MKTQGGSEGRAPLDGGATRRETSRFVAKLGAQRIRGSISSLLASGYREQRGRGVKLITRLRLVPRLRTRGAIPPPLPMHLHGAQFN